jgi:hypothetical protein
MSTLNLSDVTASTIAMFGIADSQILFRTDCVGKFMIILPTNFRMPAVH